MYEGYLQALRDDGDVWELEAREAALDVMDAIDYIDKVVSVSAMEMERES